MRREYPPPSRAAERLKEYLDLIESMEIQKGKALWYDIYRKAGSSQQTNSMIQFLEENGLVKGNKTNGYVRTDTGKTWHDTLKKNRGLVGVLTQELSGNRRKRW